MSNYINVFKQLRKELTDIYMKLEELDSMLCDIFDKEKSGAYPYSVEVLAIIYNKIIAAKEPLDTAIMIITEYLKKQEEKRACVTAVAHGVNTVSYTHLTLPTTERV